MKTLAIDTSTIVATVAILEDDQILCECILHHKWTHSQKLLPLIENMLEISEIDLSEIDLYAISIGPGSFTGLRIGVATIKGFAHVYNKKVVAVPTLDALAYNIYNNHGYICPILDAQQKSVYACLYKWENNEIIKVKDFRVIEIDSLLQDLFYYNEEIIFTGDACTIFREKIEEYKAYQIAPKTQLMPRASSVGALAIKMKDKGYMLDYNALTPYYIRKSQAEVEYEKKQTITIEKMSIEDIDEVAEIEKLCFHTPWSKKSLTDELDNALASYIVARRDGALVAYAGLWKVGDEGHINNIAVHPDFRHQGIGNTLLQALLDTSKRKGIDNFTLEVRESNAYAIALYTKYGFIKEGIRPNYYADTKENAIIMWLKKGGN